MDEINNIQNPNVLPSQPAQPSMPSPMPSMPQMPPMTQMTSSNKKNHLFLITVLSLIAVGAFAWWYINQMGEEPIVEDAPKINRDAREDIQTGNEIEGVDMGNLDAEFKLIDADVNNL